MEFDPKNPFFSQEANYINKSEHDFKTEFHYKEIKTLNDITNLSDFNISIVGNNSSSLSYNTIVFVLSGHCSINYNDNINYIFKKDDIFFLPRTSFVSCNSLKNLKLLYMTFNIPLSYVDKQNMEALSYDIQDIDFKFNALKINAPIQNFVKQLLFFFDTRGNSDYLNDLKHRELFLLLRWFYTKQELANFFYPIISKNFDFKNFILTVYPKHSKLKDLIEASNMSQNAFIKKFKDEFGVSPSKWTQVQVKNKIIHLASNPSVVIKDIMNEIEVENPTHFNRLCRRLFNMTPKEVINYYQHKVTRK